MLGQQHRWSWPELLRQLRQKLLVVWKEFPVDAAASLLPALEGRWLEGVAMGSLATEEGLWTCFPETGLTALAWPLKAWPHAPALLCNRWG